MYQKKTCYSGTHYVSYLYIILSVWPFNWLVNHCETNFVHGHIYLEEPKHLRERSSSLEVGVQVGGWVF